MREEKARCRKTMREILAGHRLHQERCRQEERDAMEVLARSRQYLHSAAILAYAATPKEFSLDLLIQRAMADGKDVFLPKSLPCDCSLAFFRLENHLPCSQQLACGSYGIREPIPGLQQYRRSPRTLILVPGLAFTTSGRRLGKGKGFYDRFLGGLRKSDCILMGVGHPCQILPQLPAEKTDIAMDFLLTPLEIISCKKQW